MARKPAKPGKPAKGSRPASAGRAAKASRPASPGRAGKGAGSPKSTRRSPVKAGGAARTGRVPPPGRTAGAQKQAKGLGGEQVEGRQAVRELLLAGTRKVKEVWLASDLDDADESGVISDILALAKDQRVQVVQVNRRRLEATARSEAPQGVLAFAAPVPEVEFDLLVRRRPGRNPFLVAVDGVTDPGNLGALLRCCDGAGVDGVVLPRHRAVHITPTVAKSAAGAIEHVPIAVVGGLPAAIARMKEAGIWVVGLDDAADRDLFDLGDLAADAICLVLGAEGAGLSRLVRERCDLVVSIPMRGRLSSLNVAAAAALATYEVTRHRNRP